MPLMVLMAGLLAGGCRSKLPPDYDPIAMRLYLEARDSEQGIAVQMPLTGTVVAVKAKALFTEADFLNAEVVQVDLGKCLLLQMTPAAARDLYRMTGTNQGSRLVLTGNDVPLGIRRIDRALDEGNLLIFLELPDDELDDLVRRVKQTSLVVQKEIARK